MTPTLEQIEVRTSRKVRSYHNGPFICEVREPGRRWVEVHPWNLESALVAMTCPACAPLRFAVCQCR
jgi:hypothetical protein